jgi:HSP20 family protein
MTLQILDIEIDQDSLVIKGHRQSENEVRDEHYYRLERSAGSFYRRLPLPEGVKPDQVKAKFNDGVLEVRLPKPEQEQPQRQRIPITTS